MVEGYTHLLINDVSYKIIGWGKKLRKTKKQQRMVEDRSKILVKCQTPRYSGHNPEQDVEFTLPWPVTNEYKSFTKKVLIKSDRTEETL